MIITDGNAGRIEAETSESLTAGIVLNFDSVDLGIALDYFEFDIQDEISRYGANTVISECYNLPPEYFRQPGTICDYVGERDEYLLFPWVNDSYFNINQQYQEGIDLTMRYGFAIGGLDFTADLRATKILEHTIEFFDGYTARRNGRTYWPEENGQLDLRAMSDSWTFYYGLEATREMAGRLNSESGTLRTRSHLRFQVDTRRWQAMHTPTVPMTDWAVRTS
jgi:iron complex outermembrane receptor protein